MWVLYHFQIIGEAVRALSADLKDHHPDVPWQEIVGMRNILVHGYFRVDLDLVWRVLTADLADLERAIEHILGT